MNAADMKILERAFALEVETALSNMEYGVDLPPLLQTKSRRAYALAERGYLKYTEHRLGGRFPVKIAGFTLTEKGRQAYCETCGSGPG